MLELGDFSKQGHFSVGEHAARTGVDVLVTVGKEAREIVEGALSVDPHMEYYVCKDNAQAVEALLNVLSAGDTVLVKGSRGMKTDEIVESLLADDLQF